MARQRQKTAFNNSLSSSAEIIREAPSANVENQGSIESSRVCSGQLIPDTMLSFFSAQAVAFAEPTYNPLKFA